MPDYDPQGRGHARSRGHEGADLSPKKIALATVLLILLLVVTHYTLDRTMHAFASGHADHSGISGLNPHAVGPQVPPDPRLQADPEKEKVELEARQIHLLSSYGTSPSPRTSAHIPIEQAKILLLRRGLPSVGIPSSPLPEEGTHVH